jgi:ubiquinone biosynthesis protein UbiJ
VAAFLSEDWFADLNASLAGAGPLPLEDSRVVRVVLEFPDAPGSAPHALTFTMSADGASAAAGDHLAADALIRLTYQDARALVEGSVTSADALRAGSVKVRGDLEAVVALVDWLRDAHPRRDA